MKLRCVMAWQHYRKGDVIEPRSAAHCDALRAMRWAGRHYWEPVEEPPAAKAAEPVPEPPAAPAAQTARKRQRVAT